ncbi:MAG: hypothetical protein ISS16_08260 [Ignavibacteria bacterium]|nr:hypothetical protein [Bacteroidota bacterium]MBL7128963.1 hypothetical protein [Ignavibacteria bacterium]
MAKKKKGSSKKVQKIIKENPVYNYILLALFAIFIILLTTFKISGDDDVFWHLATGRYIIETGTVPSTDVFGFITEGQEWMPFEWGWDVITFFIFKASGYTGLSIFRTLIFLIIFFLYFLILRKFKVSYTISTLILTLLAFGIIDRLTPRPHIISMLFFVLLLYVIIDYRYFNRENYKKLFFIPVIFLLWANLHMGILAGMLLFGIYILSEVIIFYRPQKFSSKEIIPLTKPELVRILIIFFASVLVMFINPNSFDTYLYAYAHTKMKLLETINEWRSPFDEMFSGGFVSTIYKIFLFGGVLILYYAIKKKDLFVAILFVGFVFYSVRAVRFTVDYIVICSVFLIISISFIVNNIKNESFKNFINVNPFPKVLISAALLFFIFNLPNNNLYLEHLKYYRITGFGINSDFIPTQMYDFMRENRITEIGERPFNHFGTGGSLVWNFPDSKNFIDSRNLNDEIFSEYNSIISMKPGFEKKLDEHNIDYAFYLAPDLVRIPREMEQTIISYFSKNEDWKLVFWDDKSFLFVKNLPKFKDIIDKYEYRYASPYNFKYNKKILENANVADKERVRSEINRKAAEEPNGFIINSIKQVYGK